MSKNIFLCSTQWASGGAASAALAVFVLIPSIDGLDDKARIIIISMLVMCMPLFVVASIICKLNEEAKKLDEAHSKALTLLFLPALFLLIVGLAILFYMIHILVLIAFGGAIAWITLISFYAGYRSS
ncbi:hypothetical protein ACSSUI_003448 [Vibrio cholerae]